MRSVEKRTVKFTNVPAAYVGDDTNNLVRLARAILEALAYQTHRTCRIGAGPETIGHCLANNCGRLSATSILVSKIATAPERYPKGLKVFSRNLVGAHAER